MIETLIPFALVLARRGQSSGGGCAPVGCFILLVGMGLVLFLILKGRGDRRRIEGASARPMGSGPLQPHTFACPFPKCPNCGASGDRMKQQWDGLRSVTWTCGYCGNVQVQQLTDEELPPSARQRLGLDQGMRDGNGGAGVYPGAQGGGMGNGMGGLLTGMMLGSMLGGGRSHGNDGDWGSGGSSDNWDSDSGGDWGSDDAGGGWDGGDSGGWDGGDSGGDW